MLHRVNGVQSSAHGFSARFQHLNSSEITVVHSKESEIIIPVNCQFHFTHPNAFLIAFEFQLTYIFFFFYRLEDTAASFASFSQMTYIVGH